MSSRESDSDSYSSSDEELPYAQRVHRHAARHRHPQSVNTSSLMAAASPAAMVLKSAVPSTSSLAAVSAGSYQPLKIVANPISGPLMSKTSYLRPVIEQRPNEFRNREPSYVTYRGTANIDFAELLSQADKGMELELSLGRGLGTPEFSNPVDASEEMRSYNSIDVLAGEGHFHQTNNLGLPLLMTVPNVPLHAGAQSLHNPLSVTSETPHGQLAFAVPSNETVKFKRALDPEALAFLEDYPGQKSSDQPNFVYPSGTNDKVMHVNMKPEPAAVYFYERLPEVKANPRELSLKNMALDQENSVYAPKDLMLKAIKASEDIDANIVYTDVTHPEKMRIKFSLPFETKLNALGETRGRAALGEAFRSLPQYERFLDSRLKSMSLGASPGIGSNKSPSKRSGSAPVNALVKKIEGLSDIDREFLSNNASLKINYEIKLPYYKVHPNWKYSM